MGDVLRCAKGTHRWLRVASPNLYPPVATVIVTYNSSRTIARCLQALEASTIASTILVIDNASTDDTVALLAREMPHISVTVNKDNVGFAAACNIGIELAMQSSPSTLLFLNPDAYVARDCVELLVRALETDTSAAVASPLIVEAGTETIWYAGARADVDEGIYWHVGVGEQDARQFSATTRTGRPTGCVMLVRREVVDLVGGMDPTYFLYWEDVEWSLRLKGADRSVLFVPAAMAEHDVSSSTGGVTSKVYEYYYLRNRLRLVHESTNRSRADLVVGSLRESATKVVGTWRTRGARSALAAARAITFAYIDFSRDRYGRQERL